MFRLGLHVNYDNWNSVFCWSVDCNFGKDRDEVRLGLYVTVAIVLIMEVVVEWVGDEIAIVVVVMVQCSN